MKYKNLHINFLISFWVTLISLPIHLFSQNLSSVNLLTSQTVFEAGESIVLEFETSKITILYCNSSYGTTIVYPNYEIANGYFTLPKHITTKKGIVDFQLISEGIPLYKGSISIIASTHSKTKIESYIGPPSITAGTHDYTMLVVIPSDTHDNPVADKTMVAIKHQFSEIIKEDTVQTNNFIAWKNLYSYKPSGRLLISSSVKNINSKEFSVEVFPAQPTNFEIDFTRKHTYADGNQLTTFSTSIIKDTYGNIISDGTLVDFVIKNTKGAILKTQGSTIKGVANAKMLHPDHQETWQVTAYVSGMAISNTITLQYTSVTHKLPVNFSNNNRKIIVGPLHSFMEQLIPDGAIVALSIYKQGQYLETKIETTHEGIALFYINSGFYPSGVYSFSIKALGVITECRDIKL